METTEHHAAHQPDTLMMKRQKDDLQRVLYAGFWLRFFAYIIDLIVLWGVNTIVTKPLLHWTTLEGTQLWINLFSATNIATTILFFLYFVLMTRFFQATLGKMILGLSVESLEDQTMTNSQIIFREFIGRFISTSIFNLPYLLVAFTKQHQGVHDLFADTSVIKNKFKRLNDSIQKVDKTN